MEFNDDLLCVVPIIVTEENIADAIVAYNSGDELTYDHPANWDVSTFEDFSMMFSNDATFNADISGWDTSSATSFKQMFSAAIAFNAEISYWDTSKVTSFDHMFANADTFNQPVAGWDTSLVTIISGMFYSAGYANLFNQPLHSWDVSKVRNSNIFANTIIHQNISCSIYRFLDVCSVLMCYTIGFGGICLFTWIRYETVPV